MPAHIRPKLPRGRVAHLPGALKPVASLAAATNYVIGFRGDQNPGWDALDEPGNCFYALGVQNNGAVPLLYAPDEVTLVMGGPAFDGQWGVIQSGDSRLIAMPPPGDRGEFYGWPRVALRNPSSGTALTNGATDVPGIGFDLELVPLANTYAAALDYHPLSSPSNPFAVPAHSGIIYGVGDDAVTVDIVCEYDLTLDAIKLWADAAPASASGAYTLTVTNVTSGNPVLDSPPYDLEGLSADTVTDVSGGALDSGELSYSKGDIIRLVATSDNVDLANGKVLVRLDVTAA